ncbi:unnamed protein product [Protopolystoma xenopodis]|uniref:Uncharacterized protein n=1 Tax=Protopolystoma xenopodis TaxID=117903 RepID=A0A448XG13_9PLAT|nr:unnamed protein product [Protopolystoma xenopodis]
MMPTWLTSSQLKQFAADPPFTIRRRRFWFPWFESRRGFRTVWPLLPETKQAITDEFCQLGMATHAHTHARTHTHTHAQHVFHEGMYKAG